MPILCFIRVTIPPQIVGLFYYRQPICMAKKFYWLKLKKDFFKRHDIRIIEAMPNGKDYLLFYLKMMLESIDHEGELRFNELIPYNESMLSTITNTNIDVVKSAMKIFTQLNMIDILDDQTIYMNEVNAMIGNETDSAERVRKFRENKVLMLQCNNDVTNSNTEIEIDKELELKKEKELIKVGDRELVIKDYFINLLPIEATQEFIVAWCEWVDFRKEIKKKLTVSSSKKQIEFLLKHSNPVGCINESIKNGWQGLFEEKTTNNKQKFNYQESTGNEFQIIQ